VTGHITLERIAGAMLSARATLKVEYEKLHKTVLTIVREDARSVSLPIQQSGRYKASPTRRAIFVGAAVIWETRLLK
jgi:hypothetical protein